jgi:hypothetical protein
MHEACTTEERRSVVRFLWAKGLNVKHIHKEIFLFGVGSVCPVKRLTTGSRNYLKDDRKSQMMPDHITLLRLRQKQLCRGTTFKRLLCCGFRRTRKSMRQVYQCRWKVCREINVFPRFQYHIFYFSYPVVSYLLNLPHIVHERF